MKIFIKYKHKSDAYSKDQGFYNTDRMYAWNGHVFRQLGGLSELAICIEKNKTIVVLNENVGGYLSEENADQHIEFILNPSEIAKVFPVDFLLKQQGVDLETVTVDQYLNEEVEREKAEKDFWLCKDCGAQLPECICYKQ